MEAPPTIPTLAAIERRYVLGVLQHLGGNRTRAAKALGVGLRTLQLKLKKWRVTPTKNPAVAGL